MTEYIVLFRCFSANYYTNIMMFCKKSTDRTKIELHGIITTLITNYVFIAINEQFNEVKTKFSNKSVTKY